MWDEGFLEAAGDTVRERDGRPPSESSWARTAE